MKAKCKNPDCLYEWDTNSTMLKVSCPSCGSKVELRNKREEDDGKQNKSN